MTLSDISKKAGVSIATVSRVSKNFPGVKPATRRKVLAILKEMEAEAGLLSEPEQPAVQRQCIDILICPLQEQREPIAMSYYTTVLEGIRSVLMPDRFDIQMNIHFQLKNEKGKYFRDQLHGIILVGFPEEPLVKQLGKGTVPYVILSNNPNSTWTELVSVDKYLESFQLVAKLAAQGTRRFGLLIPEIDYNVFNGVVAGLHSFGLEMASSDVAVSENTDLSSFIAPIRKLLSAPRLPEVMICINYSVLQLYQEMLKNCRPDEDETMTYVFFSDYPRQRPSRAIHIQTDSFREGVLTAEWLTEKIKRNQVMDNYRIVVPMNYLS